LDNNLFHQAKDLMAGFLTGSQGHENHLHTEKDREVVRRAIQAAYNDATPDEETQLKQFEQQLDEHIQLD
jgi:hypothetical protein